jgi:glutaminase
LAEQAEIELGDANRKRAQATALSVAPSGPPGSRSASPIVSYLERLHARHSLVDEGTIATYIPELALADPRRFGICIATVDGHLYEVGDSRDEFTIQSISKPLTYAIALAAFGEKGVRERVGVEPTGDAFNSITLTPESGRPFNPMVNAGALATVSLVARRYGSGALGHILGVFSAFAGRELAVDDAVYASEACTGHRNRAIGHLLRNFDVIESDPEPVLDLYFRQCAVAVDCRDLAVIAATLANGGVNPLTGEPVAAADDIVNVLSVMVTCGMYDGAGEWFYSVGLPAKSGVSGGLLAVLPGRLGIGVFSPPLDERGNSVRGVRVCLDLSRELNFHLLGPTGASPSPVRTSYTPASFGSKRTRSERSRDVIRAQAGRAAVYELQGELGFPAIEEVSRYFIGAGEGLTLAIVDLRRVSRVDPSVVPFFADIVAILSERGGTLALASHDRHDAFVRALAEALSSEHERALAVFAELDLALEWCEDALLAAAGELSAPGRVPLADHELLRGLTPEEVQRLVRFLRHRAFEAGTLVARKGERAGEVFLVTQGELSVMLDLPNGTRRRLATVSAGMVFGELAALDRGPRAADVRADTAVECYELAPGGLERLGQTDPLLKSVLLANLLRTVTRLARRMNDELVLLAS